MLLTVCTHMYMNNSTRVYAATLLIALYDAHSVYMCIYTPLQLWVRAFRDREFHAAVNTNNGTEALNKLLKYNFLPWKCMTLSATATLLIDRFLPETYQKYLFLNFKSSSQYRSYNSFVPEYLHGRPRSTILQCLERRSKSLKFTEDDMC